MTVKQRLQDIATNPAKYGKLIVSIVTNLVVFALTIVAVASDYSLIPDAWLPFVLLGVGVAGNYGVYAKRNRSTPGSEDGANPS